MKKDFAADGNAIFSEFLECIVTVQVEIVQIIKADIKPRTYPLYIPSIFFHSREVYKKYRRLNIKRQDNSRTNERRGEKIFIGDIIRCTRRCPHEVIWLEEYGGTYVGGMPAVYLSGLREGYAWTGEEEKVGNIFDNPELLKGE